MLRGATMLPGIMLDMGGNDRDNEEQGIRE